MKPFLCVCHALLFFVLWVATCPAQDPPASDSVDDLRREIQELRKQVQDLMKRVEELEYQRLPGIRNAQPQTAPQPGFARPGSAAPSSEPSGSKLIFPYNIERGSAAPLQPRVPLDLKLEQPRR